MKKLIAISVVFALIAGAAFAGTGFGGGTGVQIITFTSDSSDETDGAIFSGIKGAGADFSFWFGNDEGTVGGRAQFHAAPGAGWWTGAGNGIPMAFGWWKPIPQLWIQAGHNADGNWGAANITGWGWNASAQDYVAIDTDSGDGMGDLWKTARDTGFYGGFSSLGILFSVAPIDGLEINFALPFGGFDDWWAQRKPDTHPAGYTFSRFHFDVKYGISGIGNINFAFVGEGGMNSEEGEFDPIGSLYASFLLTAVDGIGVDLGVSIGLPYEDADGVDQGVALGVGLGFTFGAGDFGVKARLGAKFDRTKDGDAVGANTIGFQILPYYNLGIFTAFLNAGLGIAIPGADVDSDDAAVDWYINPYISKGMSGLTFYVGFKVGSETSVDGKNADGNDAVIRWAIPVGFAFGF